MVVRNGRKPIDMTEYKMQLIEMQQGFCPVTMNQCEPADGDVIYIKGIDYFVSAVGMKLLKERFGDKFIQERIIDNYFDDPSDDDGSIHSPAD